MGNPPNQDIASNPPPRSSPFPGIFQVATGGAGLQVCKALGWRPMTAPLPPAMASRVQSIILEGIDADPAYAAALLLDCDRIRDSRSPVLQPQFLKEER